MEEKCVQMKKQQQQAMAAATQGIYELDTRGYAPRGLCPLGAIYERGVEFDNPTLNFLFLNKK